MSLMEILRVNLLSPMVLAFVLGITAALLKSDLKIPEQVYSIISLYLLFSIGLKGGFDLAKSPLTGFLLPALAAMAIGIVIPVWSTPILRRIGGFSGTDAASIAIHYGAVSATTLSACIAFISELGVPFEGYMPTMYVVMELRAVLVGLLIARRMEGGST
ncbi:MAG: sodium-dependent bicarbonate transport family permease, partial [Chloroflexi bacterium]|nr:sodium-dependent bicarbonate transport family permease [Chloroflexota bacterium]